MINNYLVGELAVGTDARSNLEQAFKWSPKIDEEDPISDEVTELHNALLSGKNLVDRPTCDSDEVGTLEYLWLLRDTRLSTRYQRIDKVIDYITGERSEKCRSSLISRMMNYMDRLDKESPLEKESLLSIARKMRPDMNRYADIVEAACAAITSHVKDPLVAGMLQKNLHKKSKSLNLKEFDLVYTKYILNPCMKLDMTSADLWWELRLDDTLNSSTSVEGVIDSAADFIYARKTCNRFIDDAYVVGPRPKFEYIRKKSSYLMDDVKETIESKILAK